MLVRYCVRCTKDHYKAEDTAQEALCLAWENLEQLEDPQRADRWLFSIAANLLRRRDPYSGGELPPEDDLPSCESAEEQLLKEEWFREVAALIQELPMLQRQAVYFCLVLERKARPGAKCAKNGRPCARAFKSPRDCYIIEML